MAKIDRLGRPTIWTEEEINKLAESLLTWAEDDRSICLAGWKADNYLTHAKVDHLMNKSQIFTEAYRIAQLKVANRNANYLGKKVHPCHYNKYQSLYDPELKDHEKEMSLSAAAIADDRARSEAFQHSSKMLSVLSEVFKKPSGTPAQAEQADIDRSATQNHTEQT